ncbi:MAG: nicotinate-nucleotide adenylyltransferase [Anaerovoracaceae bacterium]
MSKIGILGGTFDPIHNGHITLALAAKEKADLDQVLLVPAKLQPFKLGKKITDGSDRAAMIQLAIGGKEGLYVSDYELKDEGISFTYKTLRGMKKLYGGESEIYFISGTDAFLKIMTWKNAEEILNQYGLIVGARPGYKDKELLDCIEEIRKVYNTNIIRVDEKMPDVSATEMRSCEASGKKMDQFVTPEVERYIREHGLYK